MRLAIPNPGAVVSAVERGIERGTDTLDQLMAATPRLLAVLGQAERLLVDAERLIVRVDRLVTDIEVTRVAADGVVARTDTVASRTAVLLESLEPSLTDLQPTLERLAETTNPREVDALVELVDHLPGLARKMEQDIVPVLDSLSTVAPDLHELLNVSRELNEMLAELPGLGWIRRRVDEEMAEEAPQRVTDED